MPCRYDTHKYIVSVFNFCITLVCYIVNFVDVSPIITVDLLVTSDIPELSIMEAPWRSIPVPCYKKLKPAISVYVRKCFLYISPGWTVTIFAVELSASERGKPECKH